MSDTKDLMGLMTVDPLKILEDMDNRGIEIPDHIRTIAEELSVMRSKKKKQIVLGTLNDTQKNDWLELGKLTDEIQSLREKGKIKSQLFWAKITDDYNEYGSELTIDKETMSLIKIEESENGNNGTKENKSDENDTHVVERIKDS